jgi:hypothetical protein
VAAPHAAPTIMCEGVGLRGPAGLGAAGVRPCAGDGVECAAVGSAVSGGGSAVPWNRGSRSIRFRRCPIGPSICVRDSGVERLARGSSRALRWIRRSAGVRLRARAGLTPAGYARAMTGRTPPPRRPDRPRGRGTWTLTSVTPPRWRAVSFRHRPRCLTRGVGLPPHAFVLLRRNPPKGQTRSVAPPVVCVGAPCSRDDLAQLGAAERAQPPRRRLALLPRRPGDAAVSPIWVVSAETLAPGAAP